MFGPEVWRETAGCEWSFWDLWFCVVCLLDHGGDWAKLDAALAKNRGSDAEAKWSHLTDLTARLDQAGLTAAALASEAVRDPKVRAKARTKVLKSHLYERDMTGPMRNPPSARLTAQCLFGAWPRFTVSPQPSYDTFRRYVDLDDGRFDSGWSVREVAADLREGLDGLVARARNDAVRLAARRAMLSLLYEVAEIADDSYGYLSDTAQAVIEQYARTDWRTANVAPDVYWRDLLGWCVLASNYGLLHRIEVDVFRWAKVGPDLDLVDTTLADLAGELATARMQWHADQAQAMRASAVAASGRVTRFAATGVAIGPVSRTAIEQLVDAAVRRRRPDIARQVLDAAEQAGVQPSWVRQRRAGIDGAAR